MKRSFVCVVVLLLAGVASAVEIDKKWKIVFPDMSHGADNKTSWILDQTAKAIAADIKEATGLDLQVVRSTRLEPGRPAIFLGAPAAKAAGFDLSSFTFNDNAYAVTNGNIYCFGEDHEAVKEKDPYNWRAMLAPSVRAATRFMRDVVGVRYVMPSPVGRAVPKLEKIAPPEGLYSFERPQMIFGSSWGDFIYNSAGSDYTYGRIYTYGGHSFPHAVPYELYKEHPEYFALLEDGKRHAFPKSSPLCVSNPKVQELIYAELLKMLDKGYEGCQLSQNDGPHWCCCEKCLALYGTGDDWGEKLWILFRGMAERLEKDRPGKIVHLRAYGKTKHPPKTFKKYPKNVLIELSDLTEGVLDEWMPYDVPHGFTVKTYLWGDYQHLGLTPKHSFKRLSTLVQSFFRHRVRGVYRCGYMEMPGMEGQEYYYFNRLMENPKADALETLKEYCDAAFGLQAGKPMYRFFRIIDKGLERNEQYNAGKPKQPAVEELARIYPRKALEALDEAFAAAKAAPKGEKEAIRFARLETEWGVVRTTARVAMLFDAYRKDYTFKTLKPLAEAIKERNAYIDTLYPTHDKPVPLADWPKFPLYREAPYWNVFWNGRGDVGTGESGEPFTWDPDYLVDVKPYTGAPTEVARWKKYNAEKGLKPITKWDVDRHDPGQRFELRPDGRGFLFSPGSNYMLRVTSAQMLKPNTRYRVSWFYRTENVEAKRTFESTSGFFAGLDVKRDGKMHRQAFPRPKSLLGTHPWQHMSTAVTTGEEARLFIFFRLNEVLPGGFAEVEDVTVEEL